MKRIMSIFYGKELSMHPKIIYTDKQLFANLIMKNPLDEIKKEVTFCYKTQMVIYTKLSMYIMPFL